ncbi:BRO-N domain-containing protein [Vibrio parahaemolyticus]|uniref:BRO-N domain-containing protein n=1 Tax=Vibrio parahaemolyticus TaxID=670 RepID=UPI00387B9ACE
MYQGFWLLHSVYEWRKREREREREKKKKKKKKYMNKEMQIFDYDGMNIETIMWENHKGKVVPYFKAETVAVILGFKDPTQAYKHSRHKVNISYLDVEKRKYSDSAILAESTENNNLPTPYQSLVKQGLSHNEIIVKNVWIPENDIYRLVMRSNKPDAEKFQDWVCEEVLPKIRQDGMDFSTTMSDIVVRG